VQNCDDVGFGSPGYSPPPQELLEMYDKTSFYDINRMMIAYHRYDIANDYLDITEKHLSNISLLDYGCGVGDPGVYLGSKGADVTIVDIGEKLDFASWRLQKRDIEHTSIKVQDTENPVETESEFNLIIMNEFLEHVRNPKIFLQMAIDNLSSGDIFYDAFGREYTHTVNYQHLKEAKRIAESNEYKQLHKQNFNRIGKSNFYEKT
jgi:2-polyprenyl-3-methyl-5-hydroxy-6-metoxy-1,4-benzoquinol methylase